eukprot:365222-Chlamydomonas_euryale.AAC.14
MHYTVRHTVHYTVRHAVRHAAHYTEHHTLHAVCVNVSSELSWQSEPPADRAIPNRVSGASCCLQGTTVCTIAFKK